MDFRVVVCPAKGCQSVKKFGVWKVLEWQDKVNMGKHGVVGEKCPTHREKNN